MSDALAVANRRAERYKKKMQRLTERLKLLEERNKKIHDRPSAKKLTPLSKMNKDTQGIRVPERIKRKLLFHNVFISQIKESYASCQNEKVKQSIAQILKGKILHKYRLVRRSMKVIQCYSKVNSIGNRKRSSFRNLQHTVMDFFCSDDNSSITPGKKQTLVKKKIKKQKRLLSDTMLNLHKKFCQEFPHHKICLATFYKLKPFWVVKPKLSDRDSCLCKKT